MIIAVCAKCLEEKCACDFYRRRYPEEWAERDRMGRAPLTVLEVPPIDKRYACDVL